MSDNPKLFSLEERQAIVEDCTNLLATRKVKYMEAVALRHIPRLLRHVEALEVKLRDCSGAVDSLLTLIEHEAPPDFGSNGIVGPGGGPDEGRVLTYELMNRCRDASKRAREVLK